MVLRRALLDPYGLTALDVLGMRRLHAAVARPSIGAVASLEAGSKTRATIMASTKRRGREG